MQVLPLPMANRSEFVASGRRMDSLHISLNFTLFFLLPRPSPPCPPAAASSSFSSSSRSYCFPFSTSSFVTFSLNLSLLHFFFTSRTFFIRGLLFTLFFPSKYFSNNFIYARCKSIFFYPTSVIKK